MALFNLSDITNLVNNPLILGAIVAVLVTAFKTVIETTGWLPANVGGKPNATHDLAVQLCALFGGMVAFLWAALAATPRITNGPAFALWVVINGILVGLVAMGGYAAVARRLGLPASASDGAVAPPDVLAALQAIQAQLAAHNAAHGATGHTLSIPAGAPEQAIFGQMSGGVRPPASWQVNAPPLAPGAGTGGHIQPPNAQPERAATENAESAPPPQVEVHTPIPDTFTPPGVEPEAAALSPAETQAAQQGMGV